MKTFSKKIYRWIPIMIIISITLPEKYSVIKMVFAVVAAIIAIIDLIVAVIKKLHK